MIRSENGRDWAGSCQRCGTQTAGHIMSMYSEALICFGCKDKEEKRDDYKKACDAEMSAVRAGDRKFGGLGEPRD